MQTCIVGSSEEPDVTVVVGGKEFHEYRQILRCWSGYFDGALRSGMKESNSLRFEFPHRKPEEWELIASLARPFSDAKITKDNFDIVVSWFDELASAPGMEACDEFLHSNVLRELPSIDEWGTDWPTLENCEDFQEVQLKRDLKTVLDVLGKSLQYNLPKSKRYSFKIVGNALNPTTGVPSLFGLKQCKELVSFVIKHDDCRRSELWGALKTWLPKSWSTMNPGDLTPIKQELMLQLIHAEILKEDQKYRLFVGQMQSQDEKQGKKDTDNSDIGKNLFVLSVALLMTVTWPDDSRS